jgi:hypothetical protein
MPLLDNMRRNAVTEGLLGGNRRWLVLGGIAWGFRLIGWALRKDEHVVFKEQLRPGERLVITERQSTPKRSRRRG